MFGQHVCLWIGCSFCCPTVPKHWTHKNPRHRRFPICLDRFLRAVPIISSRILVLHIKLNAAVSPSSVRLPYQPISRTTFSGWLGSNFGQHAERNSDEWTILTFWFLARLPYKCTNFPSFTNGVISYTKIASSRLTLKPINKIFR